MKRFLILLLLPLLFLTSSMRPPAERLVYSSEKVAIMTYNSFTKDFDLDKEYEITNYITVEDGELRITCSSSTCTVYAYDIREKESQTKPDQDGDVFVWWKVRNIASGRNMKVQLMFRYDKLVSLALLADDDYILYTEITRR